MTEKLNAGDPFPQLELKLAAGGTLVLPQGLGGRYNVILLYRGHW
ncbi:MAG: hypothetical protein ACT4P4_05750 [Betaproteobacteria bacterium]